MTSAQIVNIKNYLRGPYTIGTDVYDVPVPQGRRLFPGDLVNHSGDVLERKIPGPIHGVLDLLNRTGQGFTARGAPLYLFYPLNPSWPPFYISYKGTSSNNLLVTIKYEHWQSGVWPRGGVLKVHGPVGNTALERALLIQTYDTCDKIDTDVDTPFPPLLDGHLSVTWDTSFNVDPDGSKDIDDIFAWRKLGDGSTEFMIAIADVSAWIPSNCPIDIRARSLGQTLYDDGAVVTSMLPESISTRSASLRCDGVVRPVVGRVYTIRDGVVHKTTWQLHTLKLTNCFTYESILDDESMAAQLYEYLKTITNMPINPHDSHDWVAQAMIVYNHDAATLLSSSGLGVLRRHASSSVSQTAYADIAEKSGCDAIRHLGAAAGEYCTGSVSQTNHDGLGLNVYCHVSSPLRRYADLVNQRVLKYLVFGQTCALDANTMVTTEFVEHLNRRATAAKTLERELWFLTHIQPDKISMAEGIVIQCTDSVLNRWSVYVPEWRRKMTGVPCADNLLEAGCRVKIRIYCDLRRPNWSERVVCVLSTECRS